MIPYEIHRFFWDVAPEQVDPRQHAQFVIERLLQTGDRTAMRWIFATLAQDSIITALKQTRSLSRQSANYWTHYFQIDPAEVPCTQTSWHQTRRRASPQPIMLQDIAWANSKAYFQTEVARIKL